MMATGTSVAEIRAHYDEEREELRSLLTTLGEAELAASSLCEGWTVGDVAAHVAGWEELLAVRSLAAYPLVLGRLGWRYLTARGSTERLNEALRRRSERQPVEGSRTTRRVFDRLAPGSQLAELVIHQQDIRRPLDRARTIPPARLVAALDGVRRVPGIGAAGRLRQARWCATDVDWCAGRGPTVEAPGETMLLALAGRPVLDVADQR